MKSIKINIIALLVVLLAAGCDDYLDVVPKGKQVLETVEDYSKLFNSEAMLLYNRGDIIYLNDDDWGNFRIGYNSIVGNPTIIGINSLYLDPKVTPRLELYKNSTGIYTSSFNRIQNICNIILSTIDGPNIKGDNALREKTKAEAKALRAFNYFMLVNCYARHYSPETVNDLAVPLSLEYNLSENAPQATVGQIYDAIERDLDEAIPVLEKATPRQNAFHFTAAAAYALKAKVFLFKKDYAKSKEAALASYELFKKDPDFIFDLVKYSKEGMNYVVTANISENLFFSTLALNTGSPTVPAVSNIAISPDLYAKFKELDETKDMRFSGFFTFETNFAGTYALTDPNYRGDVDYAPAMDIAKKAGTKNYRYNYVGIRTTEVLLILAELEARSNNFAQAAAYVDMVRKKRIIDYSRTSTPNSRIAMMDEVMTEKRRELLFGFNRFFDLRRLNTEPEFRKNISKTYPVNPDITLFSDTDLFGGAPNGTLTLTWDSPLWVVPLPLEEFVRNPVLKYNVKY